MSNRLLPYDTIIASHPLKRQFLIALDLLP